MRKLTTLAVAATLALGVSSATLPAQASTKGHPNGPVQRCTNDDGSKPVGVTHCIWDAKHQGNGEGRSFRHTKAGNIKYITHRKAHRLTTTWDSGC